MITSTDPIADMLTRIRNAIGVRKHEVTMPHSKAKEAVAQLLKQSGFLAGVSTSEDKLGKLLTIAINDVSENAKITEITRLSKPGRRYYVGAKEIPRVKGGCGVVIVSTSKGMMTGTDAIAAGVGGELICKVY